ncbi:MAG: hypothetical protein C0469_00100 [Cyanobacteria bacterium DS2.3.42]|nr:hypothetical protein [Cyanobacteria bacterium DS2.3.42]
MLCKSLLRNCITRDGASVACLINVTATITIFVQFADSDNQRLRRRLREAPAFHHKTPVLMRFLQSSKKSHWVVFLCATGMVLGTAIGAGRIIRTVGEKLSTYPLSYHEGLAAEAVTAG